MRSTSSRKASHESAKQLFVFVISWLVLAARLSAQSRAVTFNTDIAPIIDAHCAGCHRPGGGAPFTLLSYEDARRRAALIAQVTRSRYMPPWKPEPGFGEFSGERRLTDDQLALIQQWVEGGAPGGADGDVLARPGWSDGWRLGKPDLVVTMPEPYQLPADGRDIFRTFVIPIPPAAKRYVKGLEFRPGSAPVLHHATIKIDRTRSSRLLDDEDAAPGYDGGAGRDAAFPDGHFLGWTPGQVPALLPDGMAWKLEPDSDLVLELHMMPTGKREPVQPSIGLYLTDQAPSRLSFILRLGSQSIDIPAGEKNYEVADTFVLPADVEIVGVQPHAHYLAREIKALARLPDGTTRWLLYIKDWDFRWQDVYRYRETLHLPKGTTLSMQYTYDNSAANPRNPNRPPERVTFGQTTSSEMGNLWIQVVTRNSGDLALLERDYAPKLLQGDIAGNEKMLELTPDDSRLHVDAAFLYLAASRTSDAIAHLEQAVRLAPDSPSSRYALGTMLLNQRKLAEARRQFIEAVRLKPDFSEAFNNLGVVNQAEGKLDEAIAEYMKALRLQPTNVPARYNLGRARALQADFDGAIAEYRRVLSIRADDIDTLPSLASALASTGHLDEAIGHYRHALEVRPDLPSALVDLAWILATSNRADIRSPAEAVRLAERVAELTGHQNATVLETLAVAYAAAGRPKEASGAATRALALAAAAGGQDLSRDMRKRLETYLTPELVK
jgi:tetratricopeptide (TPR) repeat protein